MYPSSRMTASLVAILAEPLVVFMRITSRTNELDQEMNL